MKDCFVIEVSYYHNNGTVLRAQHAVPRKELSSVIVEADAQVGAVAARLYVQVAAGRKKVEK